MSKIKMFILKKRFKVRTEKAVYHILIGRAEMKAWSRMDKHKKRVAILCDTLRQIEKVDKEGDNQYECFN